MSKVQQFLLIVFNSVLYFFLLNIDKTVDDVLFQNKFYKLFVLCSLIEYYFLFFQTLHIKLIAFI